MDTALEPLVNTYFVFHILCFKNVSVDTVCEFRCSGYFRVRVSCACARDRL